MNVYFTFSFAEVDACNMLVWGIMGVGRQIVLFSQMFSWGLTRAQHATRTRIRV